MKRQFVIISALLVMVLIALAWVHYARLRMSGPRLAVDNRPHVMIHFLDIGQGDASYIEFPNGEDMLVDCSADARILAALGRAMKRNDRVIDYLVVTHPHADHYGGCIDVMKQFTIRHVVYSGYLRPKDPTWQAFWQTAQTSGAEYDEITHEDRWQIGSTTIHWLYPDHPVAADTIHETAGEGHAVNDTSLVFIMTYGKMDALFTGDMEAPLESHLIDEYDKQLDVEILKVGHHGSPGSSSQPFLSAVTPQQTSISVGKNNKYGHPSRRVLKRLERLHSRIWRTDQEGDITMLVYPEYVRVMSQH